MQVLAQRTFASGSARHATGMEPHFAITTLLSRATQQAVTFQTNERSWLRLWLWLWLLIGFHFIWCFLIPFLFITLFTFVTFVIIFPNIHVLKHLKCCILCGNNLHSGRSMERNKELKLLVRAS